MRYLSIRQGNGLLSSKRTYDFVLPILFSVCATVLVRYFNISLGLFGQSGFIVGILNLLNLLIAFFIAALAAVATFDRPGLDDRMKGEPALMKRRNVQGVFRDVILTHRQFICYLFGYLSFSSIMLLLILYAVRLIGPEVVGIFDIKFSIARLDVEVRSIARFLAVFGFFFVFGQIIITMLLGIYFLTDRFQFLDDPDD